MKKTLRLIIMLCLVVSMLFASVSTVFAGARNEYVSSVNQLNQILENLNSGDKVNIYLEDDFIFTTTFVIDVPCTINFYGPAKLTSYSNRIFYLDNDNIKLFFHDVSIEGGIIGGRDFQDDGQAFYINGSNCHIEGVRVERCGSETFDNDMLKNAFSSWNGGAIYIDGWDNEIFNCYFKDCGSQDDGGAICIYYDGQLIQDCTFENCNADDDGGAIYCCVGVDDVVINRCTFTGCTCDDNTVGNNVYGRDNTIVAGVPQDQWTDELFYRCSFQTSYTASLFGTGSIIIIAAIVIVAAGVTFFVIKKKKTN